MVIRSMIIQNPLGFEIKISQSVDWIKGNLLLPSCPAVIWDKITCYDEQKYAEILDELSLAAFYGVLACRGAPPVRGKIICMN